jgi:DNA-directed RNA polymerase subunit RPC12/RpoP
VKLPKPSLSQCFDCGKKKAGCSRHFHATTRAGQVRRITTCPDCTKARCERRFHRLERDEDTSCPCGAAVVA